MTRFNCFTLAQNYCCYIIHSAQLVMSSICFLFLFCFFIKPVTPYYSETVISLLKFYDFVNFYRQLILAFSIENAGGKLKCVGSGG